MMNKHFKQVLLKSTQSKEILSIESIQSLWSGYGEILRCELDSTMFSSVIVKHVHFPTQKKHPRGWNTDLSHKRKKKSYQVESNWYKQWSSFCDESCIVPKVYALENHGDEVFIVLEDLDASGFNLRKTSASLIDMQLCLDWLANFHATFMGKKPENLWKVGTYWHLDTRPDELKALHDQPLKKAAGKIDNKLKSTAFKTFVHGDAKLANFCFSLDDSMVAAVDFQYVGGGCGMKDVAYFIGSCLYEDECEQFQDDLLDYYFSALKEALNRHKSLVDQHQLEYDWRALYPVAWTDFHRFVKGWSPGHWKIHGYSERIARETIASL